MSKTKIYIIDDEFVKENYPSLSTYNNKDLLSVILIEQKSTLTSTISFVVYQTLLQKLKDNQIEGEWIEFLNLCQYYLLFLSVQSIFDLYEKDKSADGRDHNVSNLYGKIKFAERNIKKFLNNSSIETGEEYSNEYYTGSPIYYAK